MDAEEDTADEGRGAGGERDRQEGPRAQFRHQQFDGEHHAADRRIEGRGDAGAGAGGNQRDPLPRRHVNHLAERRAERGADLDDRTFAADRGAGADRQSRRERLDQGDDRPDHAFLVVDRVHHFGHAVALRFRREVGDQERDDEPADDRHQNDEESPRARRREYAGVVSERKEPEKGDVVEQADQRAKGDRAEAGDAADDDGEQ